MMNSNSSLSQHLMGIGASHVRFLRGSSLRSCLSALVLFNKDGRGRGSSGCRDIFLLSSKVDRTCVKWPAVSDAPSSAVMTSGMVSTL